MDRNTGPPQSWWLFNQGHGLVLDSGRCFQSIEIHSAGLLLPTESKGVMSRLKPASVQVLNQPAAQVENREVHMGRSLNDHRNAGHGVEGVGVGCTQPGTEILIEFRKKLMVGEVVKLPFYKK